MHARIIFLILGGLLLLSSLDTAKHLVPNSDFRVLATGHQMRRLLVRAERENLKLRALVAKQAHPQCVTPYQPCLVPPRSIAVTAISSTFKNDLHVPDPACQSCSILNL